MLFVRCDWYLHISGGSAAMMMDNMTVTLTGGNTHCNPHLKENLFFILLVSYLELLNLCDG